MSQSVVDSLLESDGILANVYDGLRNPQVISSFTNHNQNIEKVGSLYFSSILCTSDMRLRQYSIVVACAKAFASVCTTQNQSDSCDIDYY